jgi:hypothetical protein
MTLGALLKKERRCCLIYSRAAYTIVFFAAWLGDLRSPKCKTPTPEANALRVRQKMILG